jgi:hypothetical protein
MFYFYFWGVAWIFVLKGFWACFLFFIMAPSLCPPSMQDIPCPRCYGLYILGSILKHVKLASFPRLIRLFFFFWSDFPSYDFPYFYFSYFFELTLDSI